MTQPGRVASGSPAPVGCEGSGSQHSSGPWSLRANAGSSISQLGGFGQISHSLSIAFFFFLIFKIFIYLFLAALGLRFYARAFSSCGKQGLLFVVVHGLLTVVASLVVEHGL